MSDRRRIVITGLGMISAVGMNVKSAWENILAGNSGIAPISAFDASEFSVRFGGEIKIPCGRLIMSVPLVTSR